MADVRPIDPALHGTALLESGHLALANGDRARARRELAAAEPLLVAGQGAKSSDAAEARRLLATAGGAS